MVFNCKLCDYVSNDRSNYHKHCKTILHLENIKKQSAIVEKNDSDDTNDDQNGRCCCPNCGNSYTRLSSLKRHRLTCTESKSGEDKRMLENNIVHLKEKINDRDRTIEKLEKKIDSLEQLYLKVNNDYRDCLKEYHQLASKVFTPYEDIETKSTKDITITIPNSIVQK